MAVYLGQNQVNLFGGQNVIVDGVELPELDNPGSASDLAMGKQMIDANGNVVEGTVPVVEDEARYFAYDIWDSDTSTMDEEHLSEYPDCVQILGNIFDEMLIRQYSGMYAYVPKEVFGDASPEDVRKGKTFTASGGVRAEGTMDAPSGGMVMKSGSFTAGGNTASIDTGLSSISFFVLSKTSFTETGFLTGYFKPDECRFMGCMSYGTYSKSVGFLTSTTWYNFDNGTVNLNGASDSYYLTSGKEYVWFAFGTE